ncbi:hypothetical protein I350_01947 [Cryptococcus amylolentus CBS 6273]|uniref:BZIP domain-containing protein n=1 Tax=Cryptococcus amylolentus CBS 6273 TaxID=1296118 RepID=A0A1E3K9K0_9TREE|nr:hypothetical protein I350_01947 [Cryptococcus amylolentus CBS 6273]
MHSYYFDPMADIDMAIPQGAPVDNFEELFNFDEFESAGESSTHGNSPSTASPNATPSPIFGHEPQLRNDGGNSYGFDQDLLDPALDPDYPVGLSLGETKVQPPAAALDLGLDQVKQEPLDFSMLDNGPSPSTSAPLAPLTTPVAFPGFPADQQAALQQLMESMIAYQKRFPGAASGSSETLTVEPSMLNAPSPASDSQLASQPAQQVAVAGPSSAPATVQTSPAPTSAPSSAPLPTTQNPPHSPLRSLSPIPESRNARATSTQSASTSYESLSIDSRIDALPPLSAIFSAGKGKGGKKGGGLSSVVREDGEDMDDDDSWRPSPEEYKKLSSKEKRQLRNKLSARAFRTRRKDYIGTLEGHIKDRDMVIDDIRSELTTAKNENQDLRRELEALKASTMAILHPETATPAPAPPPLVRRPTSNQINTYNPRKDLPPSLKKGRWNNDNMFGGGPTVCHTMFTPDLVLPPAETSTNVNNPKKLRSFADIPRTNMNPLLNSPPSSPKLRPLPAHQTQTPFPQPLSHPAPSLPSSTSTSLPFPDWADQTPYNARVTDLYRMQLWSRLTREAAMDKQGLDKGLRPKFWVEGPKKEAKKEDVEKVAMAAQNHITSKLATSFWSAFSSGPLGGLDSDKLSAVVTGEARLSVIPIASESPSSSSPSSPKSALSSLTSEDDSLASLMGGLKMQSGPGLAGAGAGAAGARGDPLGTLCGFLSLRGGCRPTRV